MKENIKHKLVEPIERGIIPNHFDDLGIELYLKDSSLSSFKRKYSPNYIKGICPRILYGNLKNDIGLSEFKPGMYKIDFAVAKSGGYLRWML